MKKTPLNLLPNQEDQDVPTGAPTEGARRATGVGAPVGKHDGFPDPEVTGKKPRRKFTAAYKLRILE